MLKVLQRIGKNFEEQCLFGFHFLYLQQEQFLFMGHTLFTFDHFGLSIKFWLFIDFLNYQPRLSYFYPFVLASVLVAFDFLALKFINADEDCLHKATTRYG